MKKGNPELRSPISKPRHMMDLSKLVEDKIEEEMICRGNHKWRSVWLWETKEVIERCVRCELKK